MTNETVVIESCPNCNELPRVEFTDQGVWMTCALHGHLAKGDTYEQAAEFWNVYANFVKKNMMGRTA